MLKYLDALISNFNCQLEYRNLFHKTLPKAITFNFALYSIKHFPKTVYGLLQYLL